MRSRFNPLYHLLDTDYHETFDRYAPETADFYDQVFALLPSQWTIQRRGMWFQCTSGKNIIPKQGWKIHLSATSAIAREVLTRCATVLFENGKANFKFALDTSTLLLINGKNWTRGGAAKFITVYPSDQHEFLQLIERLHQATKGLSGPYILSDYRYGDSRVVFYRYGGMKSHDVLNVRGEKTPMLTGPDGREIPDERLAYPITPAWASCPLAMNRPSAGNDEGAVVLQNRFRVEDVLSFSSAGGVYRAIDQETNQSVVVKEARPHIHEGNDGYDAVARLKNEYRFLEIFADTGIAARPICLFYEWEHWFLVEEYVEGVTLATHAAQHSILLRTRPSAEDYETWYGVFRELAIHLTRIVQTLQSRNVIFTDFSPNNLLVCAGRTDLKLIDFEGAYKAGENPGDLIYTPGFVSKNRLSRGTADFADDGYSLGAVLLAYLLPLNGLFHLQPEAKREIVASIQRDAKLPAAVGEMILNLLDEDPVRRPCTAQVLETMDQARACEEPAFLSSPGPDYGQIVHGIVNHIQEAANFSRQDRLFPSDPNLFTTNPLSTAYGASGVVYALKKITGVLPQRSVEWMLSRRISRDQYAPGLYIGLSGIAWSLLEAGVQDEAERVFELTFAHPLLDEAADLFYGMAGWGMTNLRFFHETGNELYLDHARETAQELLKPANTRSGHAWELLNEKRIGLAHGGSGIALFLLYLYLITKEERFALGGEQALNLDISCGVGTKDNGLSWPSDANATALLYPYWRYGAAGVGMAAARFYKFLNCEQYRPVLEKIFVETDRKYAVLAGRFMGLAGLGEFLLDMYDFTGEERFLQSSYKVAEGTARFRVEREGIAFPGDSLSRLSCDYGTGSAGVALFLHRLTAGGCADFMLDAFHQTETKNPARQVYAGNSKQFKAEHANASTRGEYFAGAACYY